MKKSVVGAAVFVFGGAAATTGALAITAAFAAPSNGTTFNGTTHCDPALPVCGLNPVLTGPPPPFVTIPTNCPAFLSTDNWALNFVGGNSVSHGTLNSNGDWGGGTASGPAVLTNSLGTIEYSGHLTEWFGGGQNSNPGGPPTQQSEQGFTTNFNGSGPAGTLSIHANGHFTTNNAGTPTANVTNVSVTCS